jgi:hypothetical protein
VAQQSGLGLLDFQRLAQQRIFLQIEHPQREVETGAPVSVDLAEFFGAERCPLNRRASGTVCGDLFIGVNFLRRFRWRTHGSESPWVTDPLIIDVHPQCGSSKCSHDNRSSSISLHRQRLRACLLGAQRAEHPVVHDNWPRGLQVFSGAPPTYTGVTGNEWFVREDMQFFAPAPVSIEDTDDTVQTIAHDLP